MKYTLSEAEKQMNSWLQKNKRLADYAEKVKDQTLALCKKTINELITTKMKDMYENAEETFDASDVKDFARFYLNNFDWENLNKCFARWKRSRKTNAKS